MAPGSGGGPGRYPLESVTCPPAPPAVDPSTLVHDRVEFFRTDLLS
jgi:hypothetical protein